MSEACIFCKIASKQEKSFIIWESATHMAFLSIFPNTPGVTVVIPKKHYDGYVFDLDDTALADLMLASKTVAKLIDAKLPHTLRTALVFEGYEINHVHAKLYPMHGAKQGSWHPVKSHVDKYFDNYEGYISSHNGPLANEEQLLAVQRFFK